MIRPSDKEYTITSRGDGGIVQSYDVKNVNGALIERYERVSGGWLFYGSTETGPNFFKSFAPGQIVVAANGALSARALDDYTFNVQIKADGTFFGGDPFTIDLYDDPSDLLVGTPFTRPPSSILNAPLVPIADTYVSAVLKPGLRMPYEKNRALCLKLILSGAGTIGLGDISLRFT